MAAITTQRATRNTAGEALSIAVELLKPSYRTASTLAKALKLALWPEQKARDITYALARAGERIMTYHVARQEYHAALAAVQDMEDNLPGTAGASLNTTIWRGQPEIEEQTRLRLHTAGEALRNAEDEKACEEYGPYRGAWLQVLADINEMGDHIRVYPVCRARLRGDGNDCGTPICGLSFPSSLWTRSKDGHEFVCKINWENFEKKLMALQYNDPVHAWASQMRSRYGPTHKWPQIGCGARFYPTWAESTYVVEVRRADTGQWEAFAADPPPMEITDENNMLLARLLPGPLTINTGVMRGRDPRGWGQEFAPLSPPHTHHYKDFPIIAKYPLGTWERANRPSLSLLGWCKLAVAVYSKIDPPDPKNCKLLEIFDLTRGPKQRTQQKTNLCRGRVQGTYRRGAET